MELKEIAKNSKEEIIINKSKFFAYSFSCHSVKEVEKELSILKNEHSTATHICYAYKIQPNEERCSDDGEPQGTAGKPILDVIKKSKYDNLLVAVVRYFGGVKLGAGGLLRAYSNSASSVLALSGEKISVECKKVSFEISLNQSKFTSIFSKMEFAKKIDIKYDNNIQIDIFVCDDELEKLKNNIKNILNQNIDFVVDDKTYFI